MEDLREDRIKDTVHYVIFKTGLTYYERVAVINELVLSLADEHDHIENMLRKEYLAHTLEIKMHEALKEKTGQIQP